MDIWIYIYIHIIIHVNGQYIYIYVNDNSYICICIHSDSTAGQWDECDVCVRMHICISVVDGLPGLPTAEVWRMPCQWGLNGLNCLRWRKTSWTSSTAWRNPYWAGPTKASMPLGYANINDIFGWHRHRQRLKSAAFSLATNAIPFFLSTFVNQFSQNYIKLHQIIWIIIIQFLPHFRTFFF